VAEEIELKLALPVAEQRRLLRHPVLKQGRLLSRQEIINIYFDTPDRLLLKKGVALRLRRQGGQWLQTVKAGGDAGAGLSTRPEWESAYDGRFDFSAVDAPALRRFLQSPACSERLLPCFETNFHRNTWRFEPRPGQAVLLMLDRGTTQTGGRQAVISEVELELAGAAVADLFDLAQSLAQRLPLLPALRSKAEQGYRLALDLADVPAKAETSPLHPNQSPAGAFRVIARDCLEHWLRNQPGALHSDDPEFIHQMRVALRRLQAALHLFSPFVPQARQLRPLLKPVMTALGEARDLDVLLADLVQPVVAAKPGNAALVALVTHLQGRQQAAREKAVALMLSPAQSQLLLAVLRLVHENDEGVDVGDDTSLLPFTKLGLARLRKQVSRHAARAMPADGASLHLLRIAIKRLRYSLEFFAPLLKPKSHRKLLKFLAKHQEKLGTLNDLSTMEKSLATVTVANASLIPAVKQVRRWHQRRQQKRLDQAGADLTLLRGLPALKLRKSLSRSGK